MCQLAQKLQIQLVLGVDSLVEKTKLVLNRLQDIRLFYPGLRRKVICGELSNRSASSPR